MFNHNGKEYKSKSSVVREMLEAGESRSKIALTLGITYQTVYAVEKKMTSLAKKTEGNVAKTTAKKSTKKVEKKTTTKKAPRKTKKVKDELDAVQAEVMENDVIDNPIIEDEDYDGIGSSIELD
jgi:transposase-like protein